MIDVEEIDGGLRVVDVGKNELEVGLEDWVPGGEGPPIDTAGARDDFRMGTRDQIA